METIHQGTEKKNCQFIFNIYSSLLLYLSLLCLMAFICEGKFPSELEENHDCVENTYIRMIQTNSMAFSLQANYTT
jgi:hypothetical protein